MPNPPASPASAYLRSALFVDFDNIYLRLQQEDPRAADQFATNPTRWLTWLRDHLPSAPHAEEGAEDGGPRRRKILFRRCYLNPLSFGRFRPDFSRAAFEVVDCPPLTSNGKTSADIHMVMDILDALHHETRFDEFILLSGDADFTPVLLRLSKHDRRTAVLAIGPASAAYKAACDLLIDEDSFFEEAIGAGEEQGKGALGSGTASSSALGTASLHALLLAIAERVSERVQTAGELAATDLPAIYREFPEFTASTNWLGFRSLRQMTLAVVRTREDLTVTDGDPWRVRGSEAVAEFADPAALESFTADVLAAIAEMVALADAPLPMAKVAQAVTGRFGDAVLRSRWLGAGSFRDLLLTQGIPGLAVSPGKPGFLYDPERHVLPASGTVDEVALSDPDLAPLAYRIFQVTDTPYLTPAEYARLFGWIAEEVNDNGYFLHRTSKAVRDRSLEEGSPVARMSVNFVLRGIVFSGHRLGHPGPPGQGGSESPGELARCFARNVLVLCESAGLQLAPPEREQVFRWLAGESGMIPALESEPEE